MFPRLGDRDVIVPAASIGKVLLALYYRDIKRLLLTLKSKVIIKYENDCHFELHRSAATMMDQDWTGHLPLLQR